MQARVRLTLSLHDALPISGRDALHRAERLRHVARPRRGLYRALRPARRRRGDAAQAEHGPLRLRSEQSRRGRSEEHTSELQSHVKLVCRLLLEKKNYITST